MAIILNVEYLSYSEIAKEASNFLLQNQSNSLPVPIENIIDINYNIDIVPVAGLQYLHTVDGFISSDYSRIYIDKFVFEERYYRYRFTLAHEIAHLYLHQKYLSQCKFTNIDEWGNFFESIGKSDFSIMEKQGDDFGGLVLVPKLELKKKINEYLPQVMPLIKKAKSKNISRKSYLDYAKSALAEILSPVFETSREVLSIRMNRDYIDRMIP
jgi:Zn-dependent peptidase ImmA (M78 family)